MLADLTLLAAVLIFYIGVSFGALIGGTYLYFLALEHRDRGARTTKKGRTR